MLDKTKTALLTVACFALVTGVVPLATGQGAVTPGTQPRGVRTDKVSRELQRQVEVQVLEQALTENGSTHVKRYPLLVLDQIREDFLRIQMIDRRLIQLISVPVELELGLIAKSTGEIKKRSSRLKENLALPRLQTAAADPSRIGIEVTKDRLRTSLKELSSLIDEFVSNPIFEQSKLVDPQLSAKARRDIESIIELSKRIKQTSEKLKTAEKAR